MSQLHHGNQAIKIPTDRMSLEERRQVLDSKDVYVNSQMLHECEDKLKKIAVSKNIDVLEYNALFSYHCGEFEQNYNKAVRKQFRKKYHNDQKKEFFMPYGQMYHPYNPYLQKYHGDYLRVYQEF